MLTTCAQDVVNVGVNIAMMVACLVLSYTCVPEGL